MEVGAPSPKSHLGLQLSVPRLHPAALLFFLAWSVAFALLAGYLLTYLDHAWALMAYPFAVDQGEGYDTYAGWLINLGRWIYTDNTVFPYYSSNYPPLYSYLISIPMAWLGPSLATARAVSVAATLGAGALIAWLVWHERRHAPAAAAAALLFIASNYVFHTTPLARVNATTLLLALAALATLQQARGWRLAWPAALFLAALFTKQTSVDALVAGGAWLLLARRWRETVGLTAALLGSGALLVGALEWLSGGHFWSNVVLGNVNPWDSGQTVAHYSNFLQLHAVVLGLAAIQTARELRTGAPSLFGLYFCAASALALGVGKWGAGESYFLAPLAAACVQSGKLIATIPWRSLAQPLLPVLVVLQAALFAHGPMAPLFPGREDGGFQAAALAWRPGQQEVAAGRTLVGYAQRFQGPVLAEDPGFLLVAQKPIVGNATHLRNLWQAGLWDEAGLVQDIVAGRYDFVVLEAQLYPPPVLEAIGRFYYLHDQVQLRHRRYLVFAPGSQPKGSGP